MMLQEIYRLNCELTKNDEARKNFLHRIEKELELVQAGNPSLDLSNLFIILQESNK